MKLAKSALRYIAASLLATAALIPFAVQASSDSDKPKSLEESLHEAEKLRGDVFTDIGEGVIKTYKDSIRIDSVDATIVEVLDTRARVRVDVKFSVDVKTAEGIIPTLKKHFKTNTERAEGVETLGKISVDLSECKWYECTHVGSRILRDSGVAVKVSFLGDEYFKLISEPGNFELDPGTLTFLTVVPKSKIKGDPKPVAQSEIVNVSHYWLRYVGFRTTLSKQLAPMTERCLDILESGVLGADCTPGNPHISKVDEFDKRIRQGRLIP